MVTQIQFSQGLRYFCYRHRLYECENAFCSSILQRRFTRMDRKEPSGNTLLKSTFKMLIFINLRSILLFLSPISVGHKMRSVFGVVNHNSRSYHSARISRLPSIIENAFRVLDESARTAMIRKAVTSPTQATGKIL